jgi:hypothetical protein
MLHLPPRETPKHTTILRQHCGCLNIAFRDLLLHLVSQTFRIRLASKHFPSASRQHEEILSITMPSRQCNHTPYLSEQDRQVVYLANTAFPFQR